MQPPQVPKDLPWSIQLRTRWSDEDKQSVLNNAVYLTLLEESRLQFAQSHDLLRTRNFPFLLAQCNLHFLSPGIGAAEVTVSVGVNHIGTTSFTQLYRVEGPDGTPWAEAEALLVCYDPATNRPVPLEAPMRAVLEAVAVEG
jgi:acyl-CoA thioester hydrolase